jgi:hypothetical protein
MSEDAVLTKIDKLNKIALYAKFLIEEWAATSAGEYSSEFVGLLPKLYIAVHELDEDE